MGRTLFIRTALADDEADAIKRRGDLDSHVPYLLNKAGGRYARRLSDALRPMDIRFATWRVLYTLWHRGPLFLTEMARDANFDLSTLSRIIDYIVEQGYVVAVDAPVRGNRRQVQITDAGVDIVEKCIPIAETFEEQLLKGLSPGERTLLVEILQKANANFDV